MSHIIKWTKWYRLEKCVSSVLCFVGRYITRRFECKYDEMYPLEKKTSKLILVAVKRFDNRALHKNRSVLSKKKRKQEKKTATTLKSEAYRISTAKTYT